jgi:hypothetical protein
MKIMMLVFVVLLATIPTVPDVVAQCRVGDCEEPEEDGPPELTEEDLRLIEEQEARMAESLTYECFYRLNEKYGEGHVPEDEDDPCWAMMPAPTPIPTPVPIAPTSAPTQHVDDEPLCIFGFLLC